MELEGWREEQIMSDTSYLKIFFCVCKSIGLLAILKCEPFTSYYYYYYSPLPGQHGLLLTTIICDIQLYM